MIIDGGPIYSPVDVLGDTFTLTLGAPETGLVAIIVSLAAVMVFLFELVILWREKLDVWIFFATAVFLSPALLFTVTSPESLYVRYFFVCVPFFLLLLSRFLCRCYHQGTVGKVMYVVLLGLFCYGNGLRIADFLKDGRGHYLDAVRYMAEQTEGQIITIGSDHDFRNKMVLAFYARYLPRGKKIVYFDRHAWPKEGPQWVIIHSLEKDYRPYLNFTEPNGTRYALVKSFPYSGLSGWHWFVYRQTGGPYGKEQRFHPH
jgi:hypothetical protein